MGAVNIMQRQASSSQDGWPDDSGPPADSWWWSPTGRAVRYAIVIALFVFVSGFLVAYYHARHRLKKGMQPLAYHRWMVRRQMYYAAQYPHHNRPEYNAQNDTFLGTMPGHPAPPPAYNASQPPPPRYEQAGRDNQEYEGEIGGKIAADQHYTAPVHRVGESSTNMLPPTPAPPAVPLRD